MSVRSNSNSNWRCAASRTMLSITKTSDARATRDRQYFVDRGARIDHRVACLELDRARAARFVDHQFAAVVALKDRRETMCRNIRAHSEPAYAVRSESRCPRARRSGWMRP